jgi:hypothetical protein
VAFKLIYYRKEWENILAVGASIRGLPGAREFPPETFLNEEHLVSDAHDHSNHVNTWMKQANGLSSELLLELFEQAMRALWQRAHQTLGEVTLTAITDRVLVNASERFPSFESLKVEAKGIDCRELRERAHVVNDAGDLKEGIRFVILEFLMVIGNLTGELLTPPLHSELSKIHPKDSALRGKREERKS